ncbi:MAG: hypothetical protein SFV52_09875 [Saprospiraceae bacterium]|nr:hypothetical protein [Saprospiraceae bacterium]
MRWNSIFKTLPDGATYAIVIALCVPAFWINLNVMPFIGDEGIRSGVALEMYLSGNYLTPTLNGEPYLNKPPLYNWVLVGARFLFGAFGEWPARNTTLLFLGLFAATVFVQVRNTFGKHAGILAAFMLVSSGRILFWDSMLGLIDICFSWLIYLNWMLWYQWGRKGYWWRLFVVSYGITAAAFLMKGLPALVFQAFSVPAALVLLGSWRKLFSAQHVAGVLAGILLGASYYVAYADAVSLEKAFAVLLDQSLQRTATHFGIWKTIVHLFTFPLEQVYHFLPWSLLLILVAHPRFRTMVQHEPFVRFNAWMLLVNLPVYWSSVEVYPRYLLMFVPLFNVIFVYAYRQLEPTIWARTLRWIYGAIAVAVVLAVACLPAVSRLYLLPSFHLLWLLTLIPALLVAWAVLTDSRRMLLWTVAVVLVVRIGLNLFVLPFRAEEARYGYSREQAARAVDRFPDKPWRLYGQTAMDNTARFYLENAAQQVMTRTESIDSNAVYIVERGRYPDFPGIPVDSILISGRFYVQICVFDR